MTKKISLGVVISLVFLTAALTLVITLLVFTKKYGSLVRDLPQRTQQYAQLEELDELVRLHYYGEITADAVAQGTCRGYIGGLADPYASYLSAEEYDIYKKKNAEVLPGVGVETVYDETAQGLRVILVTEDSPAFQAGIAADDLILSVNGDAVSQENQQALSVLLQTDGKDRLELLLRRSGQDTEPAETETATAPESPADNAEEIQHTDPDAQTEETQPEAATAAEENAAGPSVVSEFSVTLDRGYAAPSCKGEKRDGVGYIRISRFAGDTDTLVGEALDACLSAEVGGLIFDVRNNDGGNIAVAAKIIDRIVPLATGGTGAIATEKNAAGETVALYAADAEAVHLPICVLMNSRTGGAAELFACDLRDFGKAQLVGEPTMGHGTVQQAFELTNGDAVVLTVSEIVPYLGNSFNGSGITPDRVIPMSPADKDRLFSANAPADAQYRAALSMLLA